MALQRAQPRRSSRRRGTRLRRACGAFLRLCGAGMLARPVPSPGWLTSPATGGRWGRALPWRGQPVALVTALVTAPRAVKREGQHPTPPQGHRDAAALQPRGLSGCVSHWGPNPCGAEHWGLPRDPPGTAHTGPFPGVEKAPRNAYSAGQWEREGCPRAPPAPYPSGKPKTRRKASCAEPLPRATDRNILDFTKV